MARPGKPAIRVTGAEIQQAKACDLLGLAGRHTTLKRVAATGGGEYAGACPVPGCSADDDGFRVQPALHRWMCRRCTQGRWQDSITLQRWLTGQGFVDAVRALTDNSFSAPISLRNATTPRSLGSAPPAAWQACARDVIQKASANLWSPCAQHALRWLHDRGLQNVTLRRWNIGYIAADRHEPAWRWGLPAGRAVYLSRGILIPGVAWENIYYLKVRKLAGRPKYTQVRGSRAALYMAETIRSGLACMTEGELDALLLWQLLQQTAEPRWKAAGVVTAGSQSARLDAGPWLQCLSKLDQLLILFDQDGKSDGGAAHWAQVAAGAQVVHWPNLRSGDKDLSDYHLAGGDLVALVASAVEAAGADRILAAPARLQNAK